MTKKIPMLIALAALVGFAGSALAAEPHAAKHDPQAATTTAKPKAKETKAAPKGRSAKSTTAKSHAKAPAAPAVTPPAAR